MTILQKDLLSIKEFSKLTGVKTSTLRYYDAINLFSPASRGKNGYRYYLPQQIITINSIRTLYELDQSIREISESYDQRTPELMFDMLNEKEYLLEAERQRLKQSYKVVHTLKRMIQTGLAANEKIVEKAFFVELPIVLGPPNKFESPDCLNSEFLNFCAAATQYRIDLRLPVGRLYKDFDTFAARPAEPTHFFSVDLEGFDKRAAGHYVCGFSRGFYGEMEALVDRMRSYIRKQKLAVVGPVYSIFLHDGFSVTDADKYLLQTTVRIA